MLLIQEIKQSLYAKYQTDTLWTVDAIPFYLEKAPQSKDYPIICCYHIDSNQTMAMPTVAKPSGFDYCDARFQFSIHGNNRQHVQLEDIANRLENLFHRTSLTLGNDCTHIASICINSGTRFWNENEKIWTIALDFRFLAGR